MKNENTQAITDSHLIGYCEIHCKTERALFGSDHVNKMIELAGFPENFLKSVPAGGWYPLHAEMEELCALARAKK